MQTLASFSLRVFSEKTTYTEMSAILLDSEIVHYEVLGRGRPVIFLHGWVGSWRYWIASMQAVSTSYRTYALDLWGFGDTAKKRINYTLNEQVGLLGGFMDNLGIGKVALIGHGLGAAVASLFAARQRQSVDRILAVSLPLVPESLHPRFRALAPQELSEWLLTSDADRLETLKADPLAVVTSIEDLSSQNLDDVLGMITTPCLQVYGRNDPAVLAPNGHNPGQAEHIHQIVFDDSGHFPMLDQPSKFNRLVADFLALPSGESPRQLQLKEEWKRRVR